MRASNALLLGHIDSDRGLGRSQTEMISPFRRGSGYRFCLTPYFENYEMSVAKNKIEGEKA